MKTITEKQANKLENAYHCERVQSGSLCKECCNNKNCKDTDCPLYEWRKQ